MKKVKGGFIFLAFFFGVCGLQVNAFAENTRITSIQGTASLVRAGQNIPAAVGTECQTNDTIKTDANSVVDVSINNQAGCRIQASSEASLASTDEKEMRVKLAAGDIILNIEKLPKNSSFKVETPTAIASVRGTQFSGHVDIHLPNNPMCTFAVRENAVDISVLSTGETITLGEGQALDIPHDFSGHLTPRSAFGREIANLEQTSTVHTCS